MVTSPCRASTSWRPGGTDGKTYVSLTNVDPTRPLDVDLSAMGFKAKTAAGQTLTAPKMDSTNTFDHPDTVTPKPVAAKAGRGR
ncbi:MAG: alpha-L-arabinofuranosidase C-terminal domain-containing protein [Asticcacaulis sp.]